MRRNCVLVTLYAGSGGGGGGDLGVGFTGLSISVAHDYNSLEKIAHR